MDEKTETVIQQAETLYDNARQLAVDQDYETALQLIDQAESAFLSIQHIQWLTFTRHEKFRMRLESGQLESGQESIKLIQEGYLTTNDYQGLALATIHESILLTQNDQFESALARLRVAEAIISEHTINQLKGYLYTNFAINLMAANRYLEATASLEKAIAFYSTDSSAYERFWCFWRLAICHRHLYRFKDADRYYQVAYKGFTQTDALETGHTVLEELKEWYLERQNPERVSEIEDLMSRSSLY